MEELGSAISKSKYLSVTLQYQFKKEGAVGQMGHTSVKENSIQPDEHQIMQKERMEALEPPEMKAEPVEHKALLFKDELSQHSETLTCKSEPAASPLAFCIDAQSLDQECSDDTAIHSDSLDDVCRPQDELVACVKSDEDSAVAKPITDNYIQPAHCVDGKGPYTCDSCGSMFVSSITLNRHVPLCKGSKYERSHACKICARRFTKRGLAKHKVTHTGKHAYACDVCGKKFYLRGHLNKHSRVHTNPLFLCGKLFSSEEELVKYSQERTGKDPHSCNVCGRFFLYQMHLITHRRAHPEEYPFVCGTCGEDFSCSRTLEEHSQAHGERSVRRHWEGFCELCGKRFACRGSLAKHSRAHKGEFPYACSLCSRKFASKVDLVRHSRIHTGERPFACNTCGKCFTFKSSMVRHSRVHTGERPFACEVCGKPFSCRSNMTKHAHLHTGKHPFSCGVCEKSYACKTSLVKHLRVHPA